MQSLATADAFWQSRSENCALKAFLRKGSVAFRCCGVLNLVSSSHFKLLETLATKSGQQRQKKIEKAINSGSKKEESKKALLESLAALEKSKKCNALWKSWQQLILLRRGRDDTNETRTVILGFYLSRLASHSLHCLITSSVTLVLCSSRHTTLRSVHRFCQGRSGNCTTRALLIRNWLLSFSGNSRFSPHIRNQLEGFWLELSWGSVF